MFKNYLTIAWRNLKKHKAYTAINLVGLVVAFSSSILVFLAAYFDLSFDRFHTNSNHIFRTYSKVQTPEGVRYGNSSAYPLAPALKQAFPEVKYAARLKYGGSAVRYKGKDYNKSIRTTDPDFLKMFSFPVIKGDANTALNELSNVVLSKSFAKSIFGDEEPINKTIQLKLNNKWTDFIVTAIIDDFPQNSSIEYDGLIRIENSGDYVANKNEWNMQNHNVFIQLADNVDQAQFEKKALHFLLKNNPPSVDDIQKAHLKPDANGNYATLLLTPLKDVHFYDDSTGGTKKGYVYTLFLLAFFIMLIASINFINLSIARSFTRAKEVGVRKSIGANKGQMFLQIWGESLLICAIAFIIGLAVAYFLLPGFRSLFNTVLPFSFIAQPVTLLCILACFVLVSLISGGYPALIMSGFNTIEILKGKLTLKKRGGLRNSLIVVQFSIAVLLICSTVIVLQQLNYLRSMPLGYNKQEVISVPVSNTVDAGTFIQRMRNEFLMDPNVVAVSGTNINIGDGLDNSGNRQSYGFNYGDKNVQTDWLYVDYDYLKTLDIPLKAGRDFDRNFATDSITSVVVNESMAKQMGDKDVVGKFLWPDTAQPKMQVIGVIPDFHLYSLHEKVDPLTMQIGRGSSMSYALLRLKPGNMVTMMDKVKKFWKSELPDKEFLGSFLDENTERWFRKEQQLSTIYSIAAGIAIIISCMGLFAIALLMIEQRIKEIGVRKSLGASVQAIVTMLSKDFIKLVLVSILIASPIAWYAMNNWLKDFAYHISIQWWVFVLTGLTAITIAVLTVSYQSIRAALMNPVKSLRSE
ncbi:ABC transporter permease [Ferruginibacter paludis]|uniref:ABC transporter permease n=1 Tax=Ferruginibacter paludis TaxID=1310417 RepID=UPI0025B4BF7F|nr:ABC transporter permease [Ferruginibacter paludis]MDN3655944.1 ABC transporter permease [Ferruginibacter paludis]